MSPATSYSWHYRWHGNPAAPPILFLHGFLGSGEDWQPVIEPLSDHFHCLTLDLPGHGKTRVNGGASLYEMSSVARGVVRLLEKFWQNGWLMVGYSMGGRLGLFLTLRYPRLFKKVVLESASPGLATAAEREERIRRDEALAKQLEEEDFETFLKQWYRQPIFHSLSRHLAFSSLIQRRLRNSPAELAKSLRSMGTGRQPSLWEELSSNKVPLLLLTGESDTKFNRIAVQMVQVCDGARVRIIPGCGHNIHFENPREFARQVQTFFITD